MMFSPTFHRSETLCDSCSIISMTTDDGIELEGVIVEPDTINQTLLVFVGRSHDAVGISNRLAETYPKTRVITFNYRSYGKSEGSVNEDNIFLDALKISKLVQKNYGEYFVLGFSLGSSVASYVAAKHEVKALFLVAAFDSIALLAYTKYLKDTIFSFFNISSIFRYKFTTTLYVKNIQSDTYLFVSRDDEVTYIENARALSKDIQNLKEYVELAHLSHKELLWDGRVTNKINGIMNDTHAFT